MKSKAQADREAVLMALDQLSQTMEVMGQVVNRLKRRVELAQESARPASNPQSALARKERTERSGDSEAADPLSAEKPTILH